MKKRSALLLVCLVVFICAPAQSFRFSKPSIEDSAVISESMTGLAKQVVLKYKDQNRLTYLNNLFRLQMISGEYDAANAVIDSLRESSRLSDPLFSHLLYLQYEMYARAKLKQHATGDSFYDSFSGEFNELLLQLDDKSALQISTAFATRNGVEELRSGLQALVETAGKRDSINMTEAIELCKQYFLFEVYKNIERPAARLIKKDDDRRYIIQDSILIRTAEGATLSAVVVRKRNVSEPLPAALFVTIYSNLDQNLYEAKHSAARGYAGVVVDTRGKRLSPDAVEPYEHEATDINDVIDWISKQNWCDGRVGMYGGSYSGFAQWAAAKKMHRALKTIVPYVAAIPGLGLPMENNIFLNANYGWAFFVTNNKYLDNKTYNERQRWNAMTRNWYESGKPYRKIDSVDGTPNKWLQRWLQHPDYDKYWQNMVPFQKEYAKINIPVLTITGYYDDGQISALHYLREHYKYNKAVDHYLIIGPYDHFGAQRGGSAVLREYTVDPVALINTREITYQWLDYILKGKTKPDLLKDKINYQLMGSNEWKHVPSIDKMHNEMLTLYLTDTKAGRYNELSAVKPARKSFIQQEVDLADRSTSNNSEYYPYPVIRNELTDTSGIFFISDPISKAFSINGIFEGELKASINKKDMDIGIVLYELMPDGRYFHLSYFLGRASYAKDMTRRTLLRPGKTESIPFDRTRMVSRQLSPGSRLLVVLNINKNEDAQINYGTGKDVSDESILDAKEPLKIKWYNDSYIKIPVWKD